MSSTWRSIQPASSRRCLQALHLAERLPQSHASTETARADRARCARTCASGNTSRIVRTRAVCVGDFSTMRPIAQQRHALHEFAPRALPGLALGRGQRAQIEILVGHRSVIRKRPRQVRRRHAQIHQRELVLLRPVPAGSHIVHRPLRRKHPADQRRHEPLGPQKMMRRRSTDTCSGRCAAGRASTARAAASCRCASGRARTAAAPLSSVWRTRWLNISRSNTLAKLLSALETVIDAASGQRLGETANRLRTKQPHPRGKVHAVPEPRRPGG